MESLPASNDIVNESDKIDEESMELATEINGDEETENTEIDSNLETENTEIDSNLETENNQRANITDEEELSTSIDNSTPPVVGNIAKRGTKRKIGDTDLKPARETPRRATRSNRKSYAEEVAYTELEEEVPDDPDYKMSDSDEDPDFDPINNRAGSPDEDMHRSRRGRARGRGGGRGYRTSVDSVPASSGDEGEPQKNAESSGRTDDISDNTVSSTNGSSAGSVNPSLSSAYNYAATRTRQNAAIRLPEGPNLTDEQLKQIESQFKSGDFVMAKKDSDMMEHPPIWRIDGKSLLQKFQAFDKDGKMLYRNISTYSGWTPQAKALYVPVKVNFVFQSRYDTVVELIGFKGSSAEGDTHIAEESSAPDKSSWIMKSKCFEISDEHRVHMPSFEIYLQTLISQALDNNFLTEIYDENDAYFVDRVKMIDDLTEERKNKILEIAKWEVKFQTSLDIWPCVNTMLTKNSGMCQACGIIDATKLSQFYGQPYDNKTLRSREPTITDLELKNFQTCDGCAELSETYNKVCHQKYDYYSQCKSTVTNMRVTQPNKTTTNVLRDLLANDEWITGLFRSMCTIWIKVDGIYDTYKKKNEPDSKDPKESEESGDTATATEKSATPDEKSNEEKSATPDEDVPSDPIGESVVNSEPTTEAVEPVEPVEPVEETVFVDPPPNVET